MFTHNLKIAFRNLRKYKTQNIISVIGLAIGFVCFTFSALLIRYEMNYDSFHSKADRIYRVDLSLNKWQTISTSHSANFTKTPFNLASWLKLNFPEIEESCAINIWERGQFKILLLDQNFSNIFDFYLPEDFFYPTQTDIIPASTFRELYHDVHSIDENIYNTMIDLPRWPKNTNIPFNVAIPLTSWYSPNLWNSWHFLEFYTYILVRDGVDIERLKEKFDKILITEINAEIQTLSKLWNIDYEVPSIDYLHLVLTPLKQLRYNDPTGKIQSDFKFNHIKIFAIAGFLVILCSLLNHLILFSSRVRIRFNELAIRRAYYSSDFQIACMLIVEFLFTIVQALVIAFILMAYFLDLFKRYAGITSNNIDIFSEILLYVVFLLLCGIIVSIIPILNIRKRDLSGIVRASATFRLPNRFHTTALLIQLVVSVGLLFCTTVFIKQIHFLHQADMGLNRRNVAAVSARCCPLSHHHVLQIVQIHGILDALPIRDNAFLNNLSSGGQSRGYTKDGVQETFFYSTINADPHFFDFFGINIIEGTRHHIEFVNSFDATVVINETAAKEIGKEFLSQVFNIVGVAQDFYISPTIRTKPTIILYPNYQQFPFLQFRSIAYRFDEGLRHQTEEAVTKWFLGEFPDMGEFLIDFLYMDDVFVNYFKSERALLTILLVMSLACAIIAIFGVYSLTCLTCQQRRKEIAIRKTYGAEVIDIIDLFFKEYLILLALAALVAFPACFVIMKRWIENYVKQTSIDAWLYVAIFLAVFVVIVLSIFSTVWRAARQNPAEVVKSE